MNTRSIARSKQTDPKCMPMWYDSRRCSTCTFYTRLSGIDGSGRCAYYRNNPRRPDNAFYVAGNGAGRQEYAEHFIPYSEG